MKNNHLNLLSQLLQRYGYRQASPIKTDEFARFNGIIKDPRGKKYFMKAAFGKDSYEYKSLNRESLVTKYLSTRTKKIHISHNGYRLYIPTTAKILEMDEIFCLITRFIDGKRLADEKSNIQAEILSTTLDLVAKLRGETHISKIKPYLKNYTRSALLFSLPLRFVKAVMLSPWAITSLTRVSFKTLYFIPRNIYEYGLVHPDINVSNILFKKNAIYLTDWEEAGWGITAYNAVTPMCVHWQDQTLRNMLLKRLENNEITIPLLAYRTLMLFNQHAQGSSKKRKRDFTLLKFLETA